MPNILSRLNPFSKRSHPSSPEQWLVNFLSGDVTSAGASINETSALKYTTVYACVTLIAETVASLPLILYKKSDNGGRERATDHKLYDILHNAPNNNMTSMVFREVCQGHLLLWGNSYSLIDSDRVGRIKSITPLDPSRMTVEQTASGVRYIQTNKNNSKRIYSQDKILHVPGFGFDGLCGKSQVSLTREAMGLGVAAETFGSRFFGSGTHPGVVLEHPGALNDEGRKNLKASVSKWHEGLNKSHKLMILEEGMKATTITMPLNDAQFLETRKFQRNEICSIYKVPPHMIGDLERATFSNIEQQAISFVINTIRPWLVRWEQEMSRKLLSKADRGNGYYIEHLVDGLLRGDAAGRSDFYQKMHGIGAMSINDIRRLENMNPIDGGDQHFVPLNFIPLEMSGQSFSNEPDVIEKKNLKHEKEQRSIVEREGIKNRFLPLITSAAEKVVSFETGEIRKEIEKQSGERGKSDFIKWVKRFYKTAAPKHISRSFDAAFHAYSFAIADIAMREVGGFMNKAEQDKFVAKYVERYSARHIDSSLGQILALLGDGELDDISQRMDEWDERRAFKIGANESVRLAGASTYSAYQASGVKKVKWVTRGKNCPFCNVLRGQVVAIETPFINKDDVLYVDEKSGKHVFGGDGESLGKERDSVVSMKSTTLKKHPPLHRGCDCTISAG